MKSIQLFSLVIIGFAISSCEQIVDDIIDEALYGHHKAKCEVVHQSSVRKMAGGKAVMEVKIKNTGQLDACDVTVYATLKKGGVKHERRSAFIGYLSSKKSKTVTITFYNVIYGSEYDSVETDLWYSEVERDDYDDDDW